MATQLLDEDITGIEPDRYLTGSDRVRDITTKGVERFDVLPRQ